MQNIKNIILMNYEIKFKNKKNHIYSIKITTQLSHQKKKKKYHTTKIITRSILLKIKKKMIIEIIKFM